MENPRPQKVAVVEEVRERLGSSSAALLTEYRGLKVSELAQLRRSLRAAGGDYKVYKNTLVRLAVADRGMPEFEALLIGPTAIAFVDGDAAAVAKALRDFSRTNPNLVIKGGLLGGNLLSSAGATALAELPTREVLLAHLAGALAAPLQKMAGLLQALPRNLAYGLKALIDQGGAPGAPAPADVAEAQTAEAAGTETVGAGVVPEQGEEAIEAAEAAAPRIDEVSDGPAEEPASTGESTTQASADAVESEQ